MYQDPLAGVQVGIVEQHVLDRAIGDGNTGGVMHRDAVGDFDEQPSGVVGEVLGKAVDVEAADAGNVLAQVVAAAEAGGAGAAGQGGVGDNAIARLDAGNIRTDSDDLAGAFGADCQRIGAFGKGHAAEAPDVDMVQANRADAKLDLVRGGCIRGFALHQRNLTVGKKLERSDHGHGARVLEGCMAAQ